MTFLRMLSVILLSMLMILLSILNAIRLVDFNAGTTQLVSLDQSNNTGAIDVKMDRTVFEEKSSFKMLGLTFSSKLDWALTLSLLLKPPPRKLEP